MTQVNKAFNHSLYHRVNSNIARAQCALISDYFYNAFNCDSELLQKSHFFHGRYENIYLKDNAFKPLQHLLINATQFAAQLLNCEPHTLSMDFWFNHMAPKHITDWHRHDVMDEKLSAVFYLKVAHKSGDLLLKNAEKIERIHPKENDFIFFSPDVEHSVEENISNQSRLSIGMNFGFISDKEDDE